MQDNRSNFLYTRLSKEDGDVETGSMEESCSISSQRDCIRQYIRNELPDETAFEEIVDDGFSGTNMHRPGMQRLLHLVMEGKVKTIIVRDLSRFARNYLEAGHYLEFVFPAYGVRFISINDHFDSKALGETTGGLELAIRNLINQMYSKDISRKIKSTVDIKKLNGEFVYGTAPYGYKKGERKNTIVIDEVVAPVVRQIFTWASEGVTVTQIAVRLNTDKIMTPSVYLSSVRGKYKTRAIWTYESVRNILANRIYTGDTVPFKSHVVRVGSNRVKQIPEELQQVIPGTHEAIISREMFYQARTVIKSNKKSKSASPPNPFKSLLVCGCCGNHLVKGKPSNKNWLCSTARYTEELGCGKIRINEAELTNVILHAIMVQCKLLDERIEKIKWHGYRMRSQEEILREEHDNMLRETEQIKTGKMESYELYVEGKISKEEYIARKKILTEREESLQAQMRIAEERLLALGRKKQSIDEQMENAGKVTQYSEITELTPELTKELIQKIVILRDGGIRIVWNFKDQLEELSETVTLLHEAV